jgi:hypothetical protein
VDFGSLCYFLPPIQFPVDSKVKRHLLSTPLHAVTDTSQQGTDIVKVKNQLDVTKYAVLLPRHVSGTNISIISITIDK